MTVMDPISGPIATAAARRQLRPIPLAEKILFLSVPCGTALLWVLSTALGRAVAWDVLGLSVVIGGVCMALGICLRALTGSDRFSALTIVTGFYFAFCQLAMGCAYLRFPFPEGTIDPALARMDAALGYVWTEATLALAAVPHAGPALRPIYLSALPQLAILALFLSVIGRVAQLHRLALCVGISGVLTISIWCAAPSLGPAAFVTVPAEVEESLDLLANAAFAELLRHFATNGVAVVHPDLFTGIIALPSYHAIMALMVVWYSRRTWAFLPALVLGVLMIPATLVHGGHHLVDLFGGAAVFAVSAALAARIVPSASDPGAARAA